LLTQLSAGELLDAIRSKRTAVALGAATVAAGALIIASCPSFPLVLTALVLPAITGGFLGLAVAAISLGLVGHAALGERLGRNQRFASTGGVLAAGLMASSAISCRIARSSFWLPHWCCRCSSLSAASSRRTSTSAAPVASRIITERARRRECGTAAFG
jgi:hypothetical protein